jgi:glutamate-ammonia-ligase adenylyltransferase
MDACFAPALIGDRAGAKAIGAELGIGLGESALGDGLIAGCVAAPYLYRLARHDGATSAHRIITDGPAAMVAQALAQARAAGQIDDIPALMSALRKAKRDLHLALAVGDLAGVSSLGEITGALTRFADASLSSALGGALAQLKMRGELAEQTHDARSGPAPGFMLIAMGKQGAFELNYSSDIDFNIFYERDRLALGPRGDPGATPVRLGQTIIKIMEETTADGYVFRTDLRLRPDPGATPIAVSLAAADHYYQSLGQNWERAAYIKARACAGDLAAGERFLASLTRFVWRRSMDYAAIADVFAIKRQILTLNHGVDLDDPVFDLKLSRGGIRDIELFAQTQQLILGGRNKALRVPGTWAALEALARAGVIEAETCAALHEAYALFRGVEHRIQMLGDEQTHAIPKDSQARTHLAWLCGRADFPELAAHLAVQRRRVAAIDERFFASGSLAPAPSAAAPAPPTNEQDQATREALAKLGFHDPAPALAIIADWRAGRIRATRSPRAQGLLAALLPRLLYALANSGDGVSAFGQFADFLAGLPAGVEVLSRFAADPELLEEVCRALALAPALSRVLAQRAVLLDAMAEPHFRSPLHLDAPDARRARLAVALQDCDGFELRMNAARRFQREEAFRIGMQILMGRATSTQAGAAHADLADTCIQAMAQAAGDEMARRHGAAPGAYVVVGFGKLGGQELTAGSDLDLMLIYNAPEGAHSQGQRPLPAGDYFAKLTQRLISAIAAPTEEGHMYEVDMQLRPSGSKGPVAVRLSAFAHYYAADAWTWELQALTRARVVCADAALGRDVLDLAHAAIARPRSRAKVYADVAAMRARLLRERPVTSPWRIKHALGGMIDVEFIAQAGLLTTPQAEPAANTGQALAALAQASWLSGAQASALQSAHRLYSDLMQCLRVCLPEDSDPRAAPMPVKALLARATGFARFADLDAALTAAQDQTSKLFVTLVGPIGDGNDESERSTS